MQLRYFIDVPATLAYIVGELTATLEDDATQCEAARDNETASDLRDKVADIETVSTLIEALPDLIKALQEVQARSAPVPGYTTAGALLLRLAAVKSLARHTLEEVGVILES